MRATYAGVATACLLTLSLVTPAEAQRLTPGETVCVSIDQAHDMLVPQERAAALLLIERQFEQQGHPVVQSGCAAEFVLSHIRLREDLVVGLDGRSRRLDGHARGVDDLPALYNQMVRSLVTGKPMEGFNVVDRTNVTAAQETEAHRIRADSFGYARIGYAGTFGDRSYGGAAIGFGYRVELDSFGVDISFLNWTLPRSSGYYDTSSSALSVQALRLEAMRFVSSRANRTLYLGGGLAYGVQSFGSAGGTNDGPGGYRSRFEGNGIDGVLTLGYEGPRASTMRMFVQADVTLPFYSASSTRISYRGASGSSESRYAPSATVSLGIGWHRRGR